MQTRSKALEERHIKWLALPNEIKAAIFSHFDVRTLIKKKRVCQSWKQLCTETIDAKCTTETRIPFVNNQGLREAIQRYCGVFIQDGDMPLVYTNDDGIPEPDEAERIAQVHGWPINRWDVSTVEDLSRLFENLRMFNDDISSWNVSRARRMDSMFYMARSFQQDLSSWDVSHVTNMAQMFRCACNFNQNISHWNVSSVTNMNMMFAEASSFNQDLREWNVTRVTNMIEMFVDTSVNLDEINNDWHNWNANLLIHNREDSDLDG